MKKVSMFKQNRVTIPTNFIATILWTLDKERLDTRPEGGPAWGLMTSHNSQEGRKCYHAHPDAFRAQQCMPPHQDQEA